MSLAEQFEDLKIHVEVTCPTHLIKDQSHTFTKECGNSAIIQWVTVFGSNCPSTGNFHNGLCKITVTTPNCSFWNGEIPASKEC